MRIIQLIKKIQLVINEGYSLKDKLVLFLHYIEAPFTMRKMLLLNVTIKNKDGVYYCGNNIFSVYCASSDYEPNAKSYLHLREGSFVDIGANIGKFSVIMGLKYPKSKIVAIEAEPTNFKILKRNIHLNNLKNVCAVQSACYDEKTTIRLFKDPLGTGSHSIHKKQKEFIEIKADTLDNILREHKIGKVDLLKIDVEGAEANVIKGALKTIKRDPP